MTFVIFIVNQTHCPTFAVHGFGGYILSQLARIAQQRVSACAPRFAAVLGLACKGGSAHRLRRRRLHAAR